MREIIKEIILDGQALDIPDFVPRQLEVVPIFGKAIVCIGVRRCGKSTYLYQLIKNLTLAGVARENILYLNFFDDRLHPLQHEALNIILEVYYSLYPEKKSAEKIYCFFDEIQVIPRWELFVERLLRTEKCEVYITGSSARMLSKEIATQMRGRALSWEIFPFSFREFLRYNHIEIGSALTSKQRLLIQKAFEQYWISGAFPEVLVLEQRLRTKVHQEYFNTLLFRDIVERYDISHPKAVIDLAHKLINNVGSLYTINRLTNELKALGHKVPKTSVGNYIEWFEDAYFLFTIKIFDASVTKANVNPKKIYCIDHALVASVSSGILVNSGHLLENLVFVTLRRVTDKIYYYKTSTGREVDFIVMLEKSKPLLIQVSESLMNQQTRKRELTALMDAMRELKIPSSLIITRNDEEKIELKDLVIKVVPAWRFLLEPVEKLLP